MPLYGIGRIVPFEKGFRSASDEWNVSAERRKFFERQESVRALACSFERKVFLAYALLGFPKKIAKQDFLGR